MSVDLQHEIEDAGLDAKTYVTTPPWIGSIRFEAGQLREQGLMVGYDPQLNQPHHGQVWGKFSKSKQIQLLSTATWFVQINSVAICLKK